MSTERQSGKRVWMDGEINRSLEKALQSNAVPIEWGMYGTLIGIAICVPAILKIISWLSK